MSARVRSMTSGPPLRLIVTFALPLMVGNVFQQLYTVVDTMVVGQGLGVSALAALGAGDWIGWMSLGLMQGLTQGFGIEMAQLFGAKRYEDLRRTVGSAVTLAAISSAVLVLLFQLLARPILLALQTPADILGNALLYLRIMFLGIPIVMAYNLLSTILRSLGDGRTPLQAMIIACFLNIGLDLLFVLVFHWGIAGAAVATLMAQLFSGAYCLHQIRKIGFMALSRSDFRLRGVLARKLMQLGMPTAFMNVIIALGGMLIQMVVNGYGVLFIAGFTASNKMYGVLEIAATSYGYAVSTYVGQNLGARQLDRIKKGVRAACLIAVATSVVIMAVMLTFGRHILGLFLSGTPEEVARTLEIAYGYLAVMSGCLPILYLLYVFRSAIQGMGNTVLPMVSGVVEFAMRMGAVFTLPLIMGPEGIFLAEVLAWLGADLVLIPSYAVTLKKVSKQTTQAAP